MHHSGTNTITTPRLILRRFEAGDLNDMLRNWVSDPNIQNEYGEPARTTEAGVRHLLNCYRAEPYRWAVYENKSGQCTIVFPF